MSDPVVTLAQAFFIMNGFAVSPLPPSTSRARKKWPPLGGFLALNDQARSSTRPELFQLFAADLHGIERAMVVCHTGATLKLSPGVRKHPARMLDYLKKEWVAPINHALAGWMDAGYWTEGTRRIALVPVFPGTDPELGKAASLLRQNGADAVISLPTVLEFVLNKVDIGDTAQDVELLQMIRLLKLFDWIKSPQLELFSDDRFQQKR